MRLSDLRDCEGVDETSPSSPLSHTRVILSNLQRGLEQGHVKVESARDVFVEMIDKAKAAGGPTAVHIDELFGLLVEILVRWGPKLFFERSDPLVTHADAPAATYQPSWAFKFWLDDDVSEARKPVHTQADVAVLIREFNAGVRRRAEARVGRTNDVVWLTPKFGPVDSAIERASVVHREQGDHGLDRAGIADELRTMLGLQSRVFPERALALVVDHTIGALQAVAIEEMEQEQKSGRPQRRALAAPTQFDARDFPRFRHWPTQPGERDSDFGRTWPLNGNADASNGVPEFVGKPLDLSLISRLIPLGVVGAVQLKEADAVAADKAFADQICGAATMASLLVDIGNRLNV